MAEATDVLILARDDWANVGFGFQEALKAVGVDALCLKQNPHTFSYRDEALTVDPAEVPAWAEKAKALLFMHSRVWGVRAADYAGKKFLAVFHGGTPYRKNPVGMNKVFNPLVDATIIQTADLLGHGAKNEHWILPPVDTDAIRPGAEKVTIRDPIRVGHFPREPEKKGTDTINRVIARLQDDPYIGPRFDYYHDTEQHGWRENLRRMEDCDIYIESLQLEQDGHRLGEWGVTALEAAALRKIVISVHLSWRRYREEYGECALFGVTSEEDLFARLTALLTTNRPKLKAFQRNARKWVERLHGYEAVGERLKAVFEPALGG